MKHVFKYGVIVLASSLLVACSSSDDDDSLAGEAPENPETTQDATFEVQVSNLTNAQPLSPVAVMLHQSGFNSFIDGETSSLALELLAEGGNNADVLSEVQAATQHLASGSTEAPVPPQSISPVVSLTVSAEDLNDVRLSVISMLVRTNDAFTGVNAADLGGMGVGDSLTISGPTWDSGTEANTETAVTIPGPDFGGEGFNGVRDDILDVVRFHGGVVTNESAEFGLPSSDLEDQHRFLNPSSRIVITRVQ